MNIPPKRKEALPPGERKTSRGKGVGHRVVNTNPLADIHPLRHLKGSRGLPPLVQVHPPHIKVQGQEKGAITGGLREEKEERGDILPQMTVPTRQAKVIFRGANEKGLHHPEEVPGTKVRVEARG
jgi:hypothetical protein